MNRQNDNERLLADVLAEADAVGFHEALFGRRCVWHGGGGVSAMRAIRL
jgi:hypothetical protein